jgi:hypothetical protein
MRFESVATYHGPSYQLARLTTADFRALLINAHTMIAARERSAG